MYPDASFGHNVYVAKIAREELNVCVCVWCVKWVLSFN